jgi:chemotaxis-related protein WspB
VLPLVELRALPEASRGVAGLFNYRGQPVPAVDLCALTLQRPARECLGTRIIVVRCTSADGPEQLLGLIAEQATGMLRRECQDFVNTGLQLKDAPYLGPVATDAQGMIQWIHEDRLLTESVREVLFKQAQLAFHEPPLGAPAPCRPGPVSRSATRRQGAGAPRAHGSDARPGLEVEAPHEGH